MSAICPTCRQPIHPLIAMTWPQYQRGECSWRGQVVKLGPVSREVLLVLLQRGRSVSMPVLLESIYPDPDLEPDWAENSLRVQIGRIKARLPGIIRGRHGFGYRIEVEA